MRLVGAISGDQSGLGNVLALTWPIFAGIGIWKSTQSIWRSPLVYWGLALTAVTVLGRWFPTEGVAALFVITFALGGSISLILWLIFGRQGDSTPLPISNGNAEVSVLPPLMKSLDESYWYRRPRVVALIGGLGVALLLVITYVSSQNSTNPLADVQADGFLLCTNYDALMRAVAAGQQTESSMVMGILDLEEQAKGVDGYIGFRLGMMRDPLAQTLSDPTTIAQKHNEISVACEMYGVNVPRN